MTHIRMIAEQVAGDTGTEQQAAYTACRVALEAIPTPAAGTKWDYTNVPAELCLLYTSPSPRDRQKSRMPSSA